MLSRAFTVATVVALVFALNVSGALAGFWRTIDGISSDGILNPAQFLFGYGSGNDSFGYGYGYGYGYGTQEDGYLSETTTASPIVTSVGSVSVTVPAATTISSPDFAEDIVITDIVVASVPTSSVSIGSDTPVAALEFGIPVTNLHFSQPIQVNIPVSGYSASTIQIQVKHHGDSSFGTSGLTATSSDTCSNGIAGTPSNIATVSGWIATIYSCAASQFVAYTPAASSSSSGGGGGGGWYSSYSSTTTTTSTSTGENTEETTENTSSTTTEESTGTFSDISNSWAQSYIETLAALGIVVGNNNNEFEPNRAVTRVEFLKMALRAFGHTYSADDAFSANFDDVDSSHWTANVIGKAVGLGFVSASNDNFRPNMPISREESIKILLNVAGIATQETSTSSFSDVNGWAVRYIEKALDLGIISASSTFRPTQASTRAESAKTIVKTMNIAN